VAGSDVTGPPPLMEKSLNQAQRILEATNNLGAGALIFILRSLNSFR